MTDIAIEISALSKRYSKGSAGSLLVNGKRWRPRLILGFSSRQDTKDDDGDENYFWALKDVSFTVKRGEAVGIIGRNGAGKSTLLKILSRITAPTEGHARICGRVNSLLEIGTGFQKSLSGRDNIYLNASILGLSRTETNRLYDQIVEFSGVGEFIDMPVKYYSSGMYSRLAFAVAAHIVSDILLIDEVLAVGDAAFQKKCLHRMHDMLGSGRTILFVSHSMDSVMKFCDKAIWLERGRMAMQGDVKDVAKAYLKDVDKLCAAWQNPAPGREPGDRQGAKKAKTGTGADLISFKLLDREGKAREIFFRDEEIHVSIEYEILSISLPIIPVFHLHCGPRHAQKEEVHVFTSYDATANAARASGVYVSSAVIPAGMLNSGHYHFSVALVTPARPLIRHVKLEKLLACKVVDTYSDSAVFGRERRGVIHPQLSWRTVGVSG